MGTGVDAGAGVATGLAAGACSALESAKDQGLVTDARFDEVLRRAVAKIAGNVQLPQEAELTDTAECEQVMAELQQAAREIIRRPSESQTVHDDPGVCTWGRSQYHSGVADCGK